MTSLDLIKKIREATGAGIVDVKKALTVSENDEKKALDYLRMHGKKIADKKGSRTTSQGLIGSYVHANGRIASLVGVECETDFVVRNDDFKGFVHEIALQVAATGAQYLNSEDVPAEVIDHEREVYKAQLEKEGKPAEMIPKIVEGKLEKFYAENCLMKQKYIKDDTRTIEDLQTEIVAKIGENIKISKFTYFTLS